jgi:hypothetical protein
VVVDSVNACKVTQIQQAQASFDISSIKADL